jgi:hypothetical protein
MNKKKDKLNQVIKIYVVAHNEYTLKQSKNNDLYVPLIVGTNGEDNFGFCSDDTGDNISGKNKDYSELTGLYWIWKNSDAEIVGLIHYKRYFSKNPVYGTLKNEDIKNYLKKYDIIVAKRTKLLVPYYNHEQIFNNNDFFEELYDLTREIIKIKCPDYLNSFDKVMHGYSISYYNMFISRKEIIDRYCKWIFPLLNEIENKIDLTKYPPRLMGYLTEGYFNVWIYHDNLKIKETPVNYLGLKFKIIVSIKNNSLIRKLYSIFILPKKIREKNKL